MVRLVVHQDKFRSLPLLSFNSSVVRLVDITFAVGDRVSYKFQFQCGAIGSLFSWRPGAIDPSFNSSVVRLVADMIDIRDIAHGCFNSSVVRLVD